MRDIGPYSNYRLTVRLELANKPGIFARVAALLAEEQANLGAVDIVSATKTRMVRDITFDVQNEEHGEKVLARLAELPDVTVLSASDRIFLLHLGGKIRVGGKFPISTQKCALNGLYPGSWSCGAGDRERISQKSTRLRARAIVSRSSRTGLRCWGWAILVRRRPSLSWKGR